MALYKNRRDAGRKLANVLIEYQNREDVVVLALPRGGLPVAYEVAKALKAPLDIFLVRKLDVPGHEELSMGAIASGGTIVLNHMVVDTLGISENIIRAAADRERRDLERRELFYRASRPPLSLAGKVVILVDDGLATGSSMRAAVSGVRKQHPGQIVIAVPTASIETCDGLKNEVDRVICIANPEPFQGIGVWYDDFSQISDSEVQLLLAKAAEAIQMNQT